MTLRLITSTPSASIPEDITQETSEDDAEITESESEENEDLKDKTDPLECIEEETWVLIEDPGDAEEFAELLCQLKSVCIETVADLCYKPVSVKVRTKRRSIQITLDICSSMDNETECGDEEMMDSAEVKSTAEESEIPPDDDVWSSVSLISPVKAWKLDMNLKMEIRCLDELIAIQAIHQWTNMEHCNQSNP